MKGWVYSKEQMGTFRIPLTLHGQQANRGQLPMEKVSLQISNALLTFYENNFWIEQTNFKVFSLKLDYIKSDYKITSQEQLMPFYILPM